MPGGLRRVASAIKAALRSPSRRSSTWHHREMPQVELVLSKGCSAPILVKNIYCIGRNFVEHAQELNNPVPEEEPVIFLKSSGSLRDLRPDTTAMAFEDEDLHFEAELVLLLGEHVPLNKLAAGRELSCIQGFGLGLDLTRRGKQSELKKAGLPWTASKSFGGSAVVSPLIQPGPDEKLADVAFSLDVNGKERQYGHVSQMIFDIPSQLRYLNSLTRLLPGDLVFTGTPKGVGECRKGDSFEMKLWVGGANAQGVRSSTGWRGGTPPEKSERPRATRTYKGEL